jgi:hypothetical protein
MKVRFFIHFPVPLGNGSLYIFGEMTHNQFTQEGMMTYNPQKRGYETEMYLKQGFYNYMYLFLENNSLKGDVTYVEGNHFETQNEYMILVYYRQPGSVYDELIGVSVINTPF